MPSTGAAIGHSALVRRSERRKLIEREIGPNKII